MTNLNNIIKETGKPVLIKNYDAVVNHNFKSIDDIKKNLYLSAHYNTGFLIEKNNKFVKISSSYHGGGRYKNPSIFDVEQVKFVKKLPVKTNLGLDWEIALVEWQDHQMLTPNTKVSKDTIKERNKLDTVYTLGFLIVKDSKRIILAENIRPDLRKVRTTRVIYPKYAKNILILKKK